jgi:hypothetical protein
MKNESWEYQMSWARDMPRGANQMMNEHQDDLGTQNKKIMGPLRKSVLRKREHSLWKVESETKSGQV